MRVLFHPFHSHYVQYDKYLIVSDANEHCIKVFAGNGNFLHKFGNKGEFNNPCHLSVNKAGHLMVCETSNHSYLYSSAYDGCIPVVVSDYLTHRIYIFE